MHKTLYEPSFEHDSCGIGAIVSIDGKPSRKIVDDALSIVEKLEHRAGKDAKGETGDGVGIMTQIPHTFQSPYYYISYATSMFAALELYERGQTDFPAAQNIYRAVLYRKDGMRFRETIRAAGLSDPFREGS